MKVVVFGGSGFIGGHLVEKLVQDGHTVRIFDKNVSIKFPDIVEIGDVRDADAVSNFVKGADCIINLAAEHRDDVRPTSLYYSVNVNGAINISKAASIHNVKKVIFTSSVAVYGLNAPNANETTEISPFNEYGASKARAEEVFKSWLHDDFSNRSLTILRPVVVFGEGNKGNVFNLIEQIRRDRFLMIGDGSNRKSMAYVRNIACFIASTLYLSNGIHIFNYSDKPDMTAGELVNYIRSMLDKKTSGISIPYWLGLVGGYFFDFLTLITNKSFSISSVRIKKFCANTQVEVASLEQSGFIRPYSLKKGLEIMIADIIDGGNTHWGDGAGG